MNILVQIHGKLLPGNYKILVNFLNNGYIKSIVNIKPCIKEN
jgi:hypothetical protein